MSENLTEVSSTSIINPKKGSINTDAKFTVFTLKVCEKTLKVQNS